MSDRGILFLISVAVFVASLGVAVWLAITGQAAYLDGIFLLTCCLVLALAFGLYLRAMLKRALETTSAPATATRAATASSAAKTATPQPAAYSSGSTQTNSPSTT